MKERRKQRRVFRRTCHKCHAVKDVNRLGNCKECVVLSRRKNEAKWRKKTPGYAASWAARNPESIRTSAAKHVKAKSGRWQKAYRLSHPEKYAAYQKAYRPAHPNEYAAYRSRSRARRASAPGSHPVQEWEEKKLAFGNRCIDCGMLEGEKFKNGRVMKLTRGHAVPLSKWGGSDFISNIIPQCGPCNSRQRDYYIHPSVLGEMAA